MNKNNIFNKISKYIINLYFIVIISVLPLCFHNKYFDMIRTKADTFIFITGGTALLFIAVQLICSLLNQDGPNFQINPTDKIVFLFLIFALISTLLSENRGDAMWGTAGWHVGTSFFILCGITYFLLSRYLFWNHAFAIIAVMVNLIVLILGMLNSIGIDPLKMNENIGASDYGKYLSTIGNVNWYAGYLCMLFSLSAVVFFMSKHLIVRGIGAIIFVLCIINGIACNSDGFFLGIIPIAVYILYSAFKSKEGLERFIELIIVLEISVFITTIIKNKGG